MPQHTITRAAANIVAIVCSTPGLTDNPDDLLRAGRVADIVQEALPERPELPQDQKTANAIIKDWNSQTIDIEMKARDRATLKKVFEAAARKGVLGAGKSMNEALQFAGYESDD